MFFLLLLSSIHGLQAQDFSADITVAFNHKMNTLQLSTPERLVKLLMDSLAGHNIADKKRIYLGGGSLGAFGTYDLIIHYPNYFAAAFTQSGQANVALYPKKAANVPLWVFHGAMDDVINPWPDRSLARALQHAVAKNAGYTGYRNGRHIILDNVLAEPGLLPWLFSFKKAMHSLVTTCLPYGFIISRWFTLYIL